MNFNKKLCFTPIKSIVQLCFYVGFGAMGFLFLSMAKLRNIEYMFNILYYLFFCFTPTKV